MAAYRRQLAFQRRDDEFLYTQQRLSALFDNSLQLEFNPLWVAMLLLSLPPFSRPSRFTNVSATNTADVSLNRSVLSADIPYVPNKYIGPRTEWPKYTLAATVSVTWSVSLSIWTARIGPTDRRTDNRPVLYAYRYGCDQRKKRKRREKKQQKIR